MKRPALRPGIGAMSGEGLGVPGLLAHSECDLKGPGARDAIFDHAAESAIVGDSLATVDLQPRRRDNKTPSERFDAGIGEREAR